MGLDGSHAELRVAGRPFCWPIPDGLSTEEAACVPVPFGTADDCLFEFGQLQAGETALVHAGASGVGIAAIQLAKRAGARVVATASSPERLERLIPLGLDYGIDYTATDFAEEVAAWTDGRGADVIVDSVGGSNLQRSLQCLAYRGRCVTFGDAGRESPSTLDISTMRANNQTLVGYFLGAELFLGTRAHAMIDGHLQRHRRRPPAGGDRSAIRPRAGGRGPRLHREPAGLRTGPPHPVILRAATPADVPVLVGLIRELAAYEREPDAVVVDESMLAEALFTESPVVVRHGGRRRRSRFSGWPSTSSTSRRGPVGPASTWRTSTCAPSIVGRGWAGRCSPTWPAPPAHRGYARVDWSVLDWNEPALAFYRSIGARPMTGWTGYRLDGDALDSFGRDDA